MTEVIEAEDWLPLGSFEEEWANLWDCVGEDRHGVFHWAGIAEDEPLRTRLRRALSQHEVPLYGVYVVRTQQGPDVLYVGLAGELRRPGPRERVEFQSQTMPDRLTNTRSWPLSRTVRQFGPITIEYVVLDRDGSPRLAESLLLQAYLNEHGDLPPLNHQL